MKKMAINNVSIEGGRDDEGGIQINHKPHNNWMPTAELDSISFGRSYYKATSLIASFNQRRTTAFPMLIANFRQL